MHIKDSSDKNFPYLFFVKFLGCFFILYCFFPFYRGLTAAGGKVFSPFLYSHFNIIKVFTLFLTNSSELLLEALHYEVLQTNYHTLRISHSRAVSVNPSCLGWAVMSFWVAFVFANKAPVKHKLIWIITGIISICIINITRISLIALSSHLHWKTFVSLDHHLLFNICSYLCVFLLMYMYIRAQKNYDEPKKKAF